MVKEDTRLGLGPMTDGPVDVQLRWANLRAREHHVKGPKKSPRKMVLRRLILRKAEEAKRTTTWAPYRVQCPCLQCQNQPRWILLNFPSVDMGTLSKTVGFSLYPSHWVLCNHDFMLLFLNRAPIKVPDRNQKEQQGPFQIVSHRSRWWWQQVGRGFASHFSICDLK